MSDGDGHEESSQTRVKNGVAWRIGTDAEVSWIRGRTTPGLTIASAIPPVFDCYATVAFPADDEDRLSQLRAEHDGAILDLLIGHARSQSWWLGYLETGASEIVFDTARKVAIYSADWRYMLVEAGPEQAATWRSTDSGWKGTRLPDLIFPHDRSWLISTLWDDDWTCVGGSQALIAELVSDVRLGPRAQQVTLDQDATPAGHVAI